MDSEPKLKYFWIISSIFVAVLLIANTTASKLVSLGSFVVAGGIIIFPISYIFGDVLTEVYGYARSRKVIWTGFLCLMLMSLVYWIVGLMPYPSFWQNQQAYDAILGFVPRIVLASIIAYFVGEFSNSYVMAKMKIFSRGRHLWMRTIGSTIVGEGIDSVIFGFIAFYGVIPLEGLFLAILSGYILKVLYEIIATPFTYIIVNFLKRAEGVDVYDNKTNFNPFNVK